MKPSFARINYAELNTRQQENYNFQTIGRVLAEYGYSIIRLTDDWQGADFIAQHMDGITVLRVQQKGRLHIDKKYRGKDLWICLPDGLDAIYLFPHDEIEKLLFESGRIMKKSATLQEAPGHSQKTLSKWMLPFLKDYRLSLFPDKI